LIIAETAQFALLQSQVGVSVQYLDETGTEKIDRINIERGLLHGKKARGGSQVMMCLKLNGAGQVIKMERPSNKWIHTGTSSNHLSWFQSVNAKGKVGNLGKNIKCGQCFDLFCNWHTIEHQENSTAAKYQCCKCAEELTEANNDETWNDDNAVLKFDTSFDRNVKVNCPWPGEKFKNPDPKRHDTCECDGGGQGASRSIKAHGPKDAREFEPQVLQLENDEEEDKDDGGAADQDKEELEDKDDEEGGEAGGNPSSKEYFEEAEDVSYVGANQELLEEAEDNPL